VAEGRKRGCLHPHCHPHCPTHSSLPPSLPHVPPLQLADFGFSKDANEQSAATSRVGTPAYLAPEVVRLQPGQAYDGQVGEGLPL